MYFLGFFGKSEKRYAGMSEAWKFRGVEFWDENMIFSETWVKKTSARIRAQKPDLAWIVSFDENENRGEMMEAFVSRYSRLQDTIGNKLLPVLLRATLEPSGTQLDNLSRAEKLGWVDSVERWIALRELRNRLVHEYMESPEDLLDALNEALESVDVLLDTRTRMAGVARTLLT
ncbi:MAG: conserved hypothetical protein [Leptospirillum rubarum]|nr:MAG: conserved hypothetical protein [Leptospirillum rubarum]